MCHNSGSAYFGKKSLWESLSYDQTHRSIKKIGRSTVGSIRTLWAVHCLVLEITYCAISNEIPNVPIPSERP